MLSLNPQIRHCAPFLYEANLQGSQKDSFALPHPAQVLGNKTFKNMSCAVWIILRNIGFICGIIKSDVRIMNNGAFNDIGGVWP